MSNPTGGSRSSFVVNRIVAACVSIVILLLSHMYAPYVMDGPVICPSHGLLGLPCPGCGLTRAFCALARFDVTDAIRWNALCIPLFVLFLLTPIVTVLELAGNRRLGFYRFLYSTKVALVFGAGIAIYHVSRCVYFVYNGNMIKDYLSTSWFHNFL